MALYDTQGELQLTKACTWKQKIKMPVKPGRLHISTLNMWMCVYLYIYTRVY